VKSQQLTTSDVNPPRWYPSVTGLGRGNLARAGRPGKYRNSKSSWLRSLGSGIDRYLKRAERFNRIKTGLTGLLRQPDFGLPGSGFSDVFVKSTQTTGCQQHCQEAFATDPVGAVADNCVSLSGCEFDPLDREILESSIDLGMSQNCPSIFNIRRMDCPHRKPLFGRILLNRPLVRDFFEKRPFDPGFFSQRVSTSLEQPSPFFLSCRAFKSAEDQLEEVLLAWANKNANVTDVEHAIHVRDEHCNACFRAFAVGLGCKVSPTVKFSKGEANRAMELCLGSANCDPSFKFFYPGIEIPEGRDVDLGFSLYMGKKVFAPGNPLSPPSLSDYIEVMKTPPRNNLPPDFQIFFKRLFRHLCHKPKDFAWEKLPPLCSPKSCIELSALEGGKRAFHYQSSEDLFHDRYAVIPKIIYTGGKHRTVTIGSAGCDKYHFFNTLMGGRIRRFKSSVFGREIEGWCEDVSPFIRGILGSLKFVSGDLKSATDLLHTDIMALACDELVDQFALNEEDEELLRGYSYKARYYKRVGGKVVPLTNCTCLGPCRHFQSQCGGFNMGSDVSFPVLCATSLAIIMDSHGDLNKAINIVDGRKFIEYVSSWCKGGFNGDDTVIVGVSGIENKWKSAVEKVNGVAEMSKSPLSDEYLTINSALFRWDSVLGRLSRVLTVHPGKLVSVLGGAAKSPDRHWVELLKCEPLTSRNLSIDLAMRNWLPVQLGGTGLVKKKLDKKVLVQQFLFSIASRPTPISETMRFVNFGIDSGRQETMRVSGFFKVNRSFWEMHVKDRYRSKGAIYWTHDPVKVSVSDSDIDKIILASYDPEVQDNCVRLIDMYQQAQDNGELILHDVAVPITAPITPLKVPRVVGWSMDKPLSEQALKKKFPQFDSLDRECDTAYEVLPWTERERALIEQLSMV